MFGCDWLVCTVRCPRTLYARHVSVADSGHRDHGPPEPVRNALEVAQRTARLRKVDSAAEKHHS